MAIQHDRAFTEGGDRYYLGAIERQRQRRLRQEAELAQKAGWGKLYAEMEQGCGPQGCPGTSEFDPQSYDPNRFGLKDWAAWQGPDHRLVTLGSPPPRGEHHGGHPIHVSIEPYAPGTFFGGAGGWGHGGI